ncbi:lipid II flippase MurJ [Algicella marina]|uniref:Murein biosynthesis integral membrane protein MurJ n=1 Tax=Algicella marina TaxID=2683284 RepID=A0A6P1T4Q9_9RHOB|nr:lipid II flippase MurJ [Algicella marina]QHQ36700.1 hypothetical protein GO499_16725 [Algicella marina]
MSTVAKSTLALTAALMLGRLFGFLREVLLAAKLGVSAEADMAVLILTLPDFLITLLLAGGFSAALVPALRRAEGDDREVLFRYVATLALLVSLAVALVIALYPAGVFRLLAPALTAEAYTPHLLAMRLTALSIPLAALSGVLGALLNARNIFFVVGLGTGVYNLVLCIVLFALPGGAALILPLALGVLAAAVARTSMLLVNARPRLLPQWRAPAGADVRLLRLFVAGVLAVGITAAAQILFRTVAGLAEPGALTAFSYGLKLFMLPLFLLFAPLATVLLPRFTDDMGATRLPAAALSVTLVLSGAVLAAGQVAGNDIARLILYRGAMDEAGLAAVTIAARWMFLALPFAALELIAAARLNAVQRTGRVMLDAAVALAIAGALAIAVPALVLPAFVLFYALAALLHLAAMPVPWVGILRWLSPMRLLLATAFLAGAYAFDRLVVPEGAVWLHAFAGLVIFCGVSAVWADKFRAVVRIR